MDDMQEHAARQFISRIAHLGWSKAEVERETGMSFKTVDKVISQGVLPKRQDKKRELAVGLGLVPDAVDRILAGEWMKDVLDRNWVNPVTAKRSVEERLSALERQMAGTRYNLEALAARVYELWPELGDQTTHES